MKNWFESYIIEPVKKKVHQFEKKFTPLVAKVWKTILIVGNNLLTLKSD